MDISIETSIGHVRKVNQDFARYFVNQSGIYLLILCDGMGGHNGGDIASEMAVNHMGHAWKEATTQTITEATGWLDEHIRNENQRIYDTSLRYKDLEGMGTTLVAAVFIGRNVVIASVGDSRAYIYQDNSFMQVTEDDTYVNELIKSGEITQQEAIEHPQRNILIQSLGVEEPINVMIDTFRFEWNGTLLLATDGLYEGVAEEDIISVVHVRGKTSKDKAEELLQMALEKAGDDNVTVCVAQHNIEKEGE